MCYICVIYIFWGELIKQSKIGEEVLTLKYLWIATTVMSAMLAERLVNIRKRLIRHMPSPNTQCLLSKASILSGRLTRTRKSAMTRLKRNRLLGFQALTLKQNIHKETTFPSIPSMTSTVRTGGRIKPSNWIPTGGQAPTAGAGVVWSRLEVVRLNICSDSILTRIGLATFKKAQSALMSKMKMPLWAQRGMFSLWGNHFFLFSTSGLSIKNLYKEKKQMT